MVLRYEDLPSELNLASWFVDRNVEEGRGHRTALVTDRRAGGESPGEGGEGGTAGEGGEGRTAGEGGEGGGTGGDAGAGDEVAGDAGHERGGRATTYAELAALTNRVGNVLRDLGVQRQQRVLLALSDGVEFVATWYGAQKIGAVTAEVYTYLQPKDYAYYLDYTEAEVVVADGVTLGRLREARTAGGGHLRHLLVVGVPDDELQAGEHSFEALVAAAPDVLDPAPTTRDDVAIWKFTTGSTGAPKACVHPTHSALLSFDWYARGVLDIGVHDLVLPVPKLFFGYARDLAALYPFGVGGAGIVFPERTTPERIFELVARHRPTILVNVPTMMSAMVAHPDAGQQNLGCLRLCTSAGEALPAELHQKWDRTFGVEVVDGIGSSEAYHIYISNRPGRGRPGTVGQEVPGYRARVVDAEGEPVPDGEVGILEVTGETVALEYWDAPEKTAATFRGDTVRTGDLFMRDADGFFSYRGRTDNLLKVGGVWVAPSEVEHCLIGHPDVVECAVVGHEHDGLVRPRAYVVVRPGAGVSAEALIDYARSGLSPHKRPRDVVFVDQLPRTANGKLDRKALLAPDRRGPA